MCRCAGWWWIGHRQMTYVQLNVILYGYLCRPPEDLWSFFDDFSPGHVAAMAPCLYHYDTPRNKVTEDSWKCLYWLLNETVQVPFYGETGLNAGIMHMDLDRMRDIPDGWTRANMAMHDKFRTRIKLADQDILNILFHYYPDMLYELPCEWNYRVWQCSQVFKI